MSEVLCPYCGGEMRHVATRWSDAEYYECKGCHSRSPSANCMKVKEAALTRKGSPAVHGRWESCYEDWRHQLEGNKCSVCGFEYYGNFFKYCPNCGAKMEGCAVDG